MVARNYEKAAQAVKDVSDVSQSAHNDMKRLFPVVCDHASFASVRKFCQDLKEELRSESEKTGHQVGIDLLCLNAAVFLGEDSDAQYTEDNLELTMQTNHFAPFLIATQLFEWINPGARVVVTTSGLHALPETTFGNFEGVFDWTTREVKSKFEMIDDTPFNHKRSYATSKLCNVAFCLALNRRLKNRGAKAVCFTPGLIPTSGLFRHQKRWHETYLKEHGASIAETDDWGGILLAWTAYSDKAAEIGGSYWRAPFGISNRGGKIPDDLYVASVNEEAEKVSNQETLWEISCKLTSMGTVASFVG
jgi:NAD(P)-dependent dehydrogenase (short-subunit alcohol dehydrogenase family)